MEEVAPQQLSLPVFMEVHKHSPRKEILGIVDAMVKTAQDKAHQAAEVQKACAYEHSLAVAAMAATNHYVESMDVPALQAEFSRLEALRRQTYKECEELAARLADLSKQEYGAEEQMANNRLLQDYVERMRELNERVM